MGLPPAIPLIETPSAIMLTSRTSPSATIPFIAATALSAASCEMKQIVTFESIRAHAVIVPKTANVTEMSCMVADSEMFRTQIEVGFCCWEPAPWSKAWFLGLLINCLICSARADGLCCAASTVTMMLFGCLVLLILLILSILSIPFHPFSLSNVGTQGAQ